MEKWWMWYQRVLCSWRIWKKSSFLVKVKKVKIDTGLGDDGCCAIIKQSKYLKNLEKLDLSGKNAQLKIGNEITSKSCKQLGENVKYLRKLKQLLLDGKNENKIENKIGDNGCISLLKDAKYLSNLEELGLYGNEV